MAVFSKRIYETRAAPTVDAKAVAEAMLKHIRSLEAQTKRLEQRLADVELLLTAGLKKPVDKGAR